MDDKLVDFKLCVEALGGFSMSRLKDRIEVQKKIYLLQLSGVDLGYRFNWYINGPYSPTLADTAFEVWNNNSLSEYVEDYELKEETLEKIISIKELLETVPPDDLERHEWLELLASIHFLKHVAFIPNTDKNNKDQFCEAVLEKKPKYTHDQVYRAWDVLNEWGLIDNKTVE